MIGTHKTTQRIKDDMLSVVYHNTEVVKVRNNRYITLNNGGYYTATTKRRMNQASQQYNLGFSVYQSDFTWYVRCGDDIEPYYNGITIDKETKLISRKLREIN